MSMPFSDEDLQEPVSNIITTKKFIVEKNLKELIHPELEIVNVAQGMEKDI